MLSGFRFGGVEFDFYGAEELDAERRNFEADTDEKTH